MDYSPRQELALIADLLQSLHANALETSDTEEIGRIQDAVTKAQLLAELVKQAGPNNDNELREALGSHLIDLVDIRWLACIRFALPLGIRQKQSASLTQICRAAQMLLDWIIGPSDNLIEAELNQREFEEKNDYDDIQQFQTRSYRNPLTELHYRGSRDVLEAARELCASKDERRRELGADILGQLGVPERTFPNECFEILAGLLEHETNPSVLNAIGIAFGHLRNPKAVELVATLVDHPEWQVRYGVIHAVSIHEDDMAIGLLFRLMNDEDEVIRDWATFGLGSLNEADSPAIRDALAERLGDTDPIVRGEALVGLARRGDGRSISALLKEIQSDEFLAEADGYIVEAADELKERDMFDKLVDALHGVSWPEQSEQRRILDELVSDDTDGEDT